ncbi:MAG: ABC transporter permease [Chloroflexi bacterium]|nr:ABC transporter permease [Chloroflexota bacterium]
MLSGRYLVARLLGAVLVLWGVTTVAFVVLRLSGDPVLLLVPAEATAADIEEMRTVLGLADPIPQQYVRFLGGAVRGDFGNSLWQRQPALPLVLERLPATTILALAALFLAVVVAIPSGIFAATRAGSPLDTLSMLLAVIGQSMPHFWLGLMLLLLFAVQLRWLPATVDNSPRSLVLPAATLGLALMARIARLSRSGMLEVLEQDYIRTARAKGLHERVVLYRHALKNASLAIVTVIGLQLGYLLGGTVIVETVFGWPGIGSLAISAISHRDYPVVQAVVIMSAALLVLLNILVDMVYTWLDPRIKYH